MTGERRAIILKGSYRGANLGEISIYRISYNATNSTVPCATLIRVSGTNEGCPHLNSWHGHVLTCVTSSLCDPCDCTAHVCTLESNRFVLTECGWASWAPGQTHLLPATTKSFGSVIVCLLSATLSPPPLHHKVIYDVGPTFNMYEVSYWYKRSRYFEDTTRLNLSNNCFRYFKLA